MIIRRTRTLCLARVILVGGVTLPAACSTQSSASGSAEATSEEGQQTGDGGEPEFRHVAGLRIVDVYANQAVQTPLWRGGEVWWGGGQWVDGANRNAVLVPGRPTVVRATWETEDEWTPREVRAQLSVEHPDGEIVFLQSETRVDRAANLDHLDTTFAWGLDPDLARPGTRISVEVFELDPLWLNEPEPEQWSRVPEDGSILVGFEPEAPDFDLVLVPIFQQFDGCDRTTDLEGYPDQFEAWARAVLPVRSSDLTLTVHDPIVVSTNTELQLLPLFNQVVALREADRSRAFYYAVLDPAPVEGCPAVSLETTVQVSAGQLAAVMHTRPDSRNALFWGIGTGLGLRNVGCPESSQGQGSPDSAYPYVDGRIGRHGYDASTNAILPPDFTWSFMSDCDPDWISDYEWNKIHERLSLIDDE